MAPDFHSGWLHHNCMLRIPMGNNFLDNGHPVNFPRTVYLQIARFCDPVGRASCYQMAKFSEVGVPDFVEPVLSDFFDFSPHLVAIDNIIRDLSFPNYKQNSREKK